MIFFQAFSNSVDVLCKVPLSPQAQDFIKCRLCDLGSYDFTCIVRLSVPPFHHAFLDIKTEMEKPVRNLFFSKWAWFKLLLFSVWPSDSDNVSGSTFLSRLVILFPRATLRHCMLRTVSVSWVGFPPYSGKPSTVLPPLPLIWVRAPSLFAPITQCSNFSHCKEIACFTACYP